MTKSLIPTQGDDSLTGEEVHATKNRAEMKAVILSFLKQGRVLKMRLSIKVTITTVCR